MFKKICICGSMRFYTTMILQAERLTSEGYIVLMPFLKKDGTNDIQLDLMHKQKIDMCDEVLIVNTNGITKYIGQSTLDEIAYAHKQGKEIFYLDLILASKGKN